MNNKGLVQNKTNLVAFYKPVDAVFFRVEALASLKLDLGTADVDDAAEIEDWEVVAFIGPFEGGFTISDVLLEDGALKREVGITVALRLCGACCCKGFLTNDDSDFCTKYWWLFWL